ncbi:MAG TPA: hypothetical protein VME67_22805 [Mycobacterium sp.]|nr:hypothetical protein [Mycobacterium sp.]HTX97412.1 hypothetical protein [Mycobacterium sp.]
MPQRRLADTSVHYYLILFDKDGKERKEADGTLLSATILDAVGEGTTDVFVASHGWQGDIPAAISQYDRWVKVMADQHRDAERERALLGDFRPMTIGIHWPSRPWGVEDVGAALLAGSADASRDDEFAGERELGWPQLVESYADRIADTSASRAALELIMRAADDAGDEPATATRVEFSPELGAAYQTLFTEAGLGAGGVCAPPGADQGGFAPADMAREWMEALTSPGCISGWVMSLLSASAGVRRWTSGWVSCSSAPSAPTVRRGCTLTCSTRAGGSA